MGLKIHPLHVGSFEVSRASLTYQRGYSETTRIPVLMFLIAGGEFPVLVDTGTANPGQIRSRHQFELERTPEQEPAYALRNIGVDPADVRMVINSHLHWDHCGNNDLFPHARVVVQKSELLYAIDPLPPNRRVYERARGMSPSWIAGLDRIETISGDTELLPGIRAVHLPGHSPGSQGVLVETAVGRFLIAGDCVSCYENWHGDDRVDHIPTGGFTSLEEFVGSFSKIERLDCTPIPSHDFRVLDHEVYG